MKTYYIVIVGLFLSAATGRGSEWYDRRSIELEGALKLENPKEKIEALGKFMGIATNLEMTEEQQTLFSKAQEALMNIPGHAKYYQDKIEFMKAQVIANEAKGGDLYEEGDIGASDYDSFRSKAFGTLKYIPSYETVGVLGHFLSDPEGREDRTNVAGRRPINCLEATRALNNLGIEKPPVSGPLVSDNMVAQVDAWKDWWNEVKAGKRTYHFKGSPIEYGPNGPVSPKEVSRREHDRPPATATLDRPPVPSLTPAPVTEPPNTGTSPWGKVAGGMAMLLLLIGGWLAFGKRRTNAN